MNQYSRKIRLSSITRMAALVLVLGTGGGCATVDTLGAANDGPPHGPLVMSGTRFDLQALTDREGARDRFNINGPRLPLLDLPFSFLLDAIVLPGTLFAALGNR